MPKARWNWAGLLLLWVTGVLLWTLAAARGLGEPPLHALPFGIVQMGVAAVLAIGVWYLTGGRSVAGCGRALRGRCRCPPYGISRPTTTT